jgi:leucyl aminopeptidase (aminopeptidase T)
MGNVTPQIMREGMLADYHQVYELTMEVFEIVKDAKIIEASSKRGSQLVVTFDPTMKWVPSHGLIHEMGMFGNLPDGEVFTSPDSVEGVLFADVLGDYFEGILKDSISFEISKSEVVDIRCENSELVEEVEKYLDSSKNGRRVGEFAIGTNTAVKELVGRMIQDEKIPGIHIAFGNPLGYATGATWTSDVHLDVVPTCCTIEVDGRVIMEEGNFLI